MADGHSQLEKAIAKVVSELREGLRHGFFDYRLRGEIVNGRKRQVVLEAGKKYKFTIPEEELDGALTADWRLPRRERRTTGL
jgi:hypothetical protein